MTITLEKILGALTGKENLYRCGRNFTKIETEVNAHGTQINKFAAEIKEPNYTPSMKRQEPIFSVGTGYVNNVLTDLKSDIIKGQVPINAKGLSVVNMLNVCNVSSTIAISTVAAIYPQKDGTMATITGNMRTFNIIAGHKYFIRVKLKSTSTVNIDRAIISGLGISGQNSKDAYTIITATANENGAYLYTQTVAGQTGNLITDFAMVYDLTQAGLDTLTIEQAYQILNYVSGIGSVNGANVKSRGKNLFTGELVAGGFSGATGGLDATANTWRANLEYLHIKNNINYCISWVGALQNGLYIFFYDENKKYIEFSTNDTIKTFNLSNAKFIRLCWNHATLDDIQLEEGAVATAYEPYQESISPLPKLCSVPSGAYDETVEGKSTKRIAEHTLVASNITSLGTGSTTNDYIVFVPPSNALGIGLAEKSKSMLINGYVPSNAVYSDSANLIGSYCWGTGTLSENRAILVFAKGTYASLAAAQTALTGTKILYQLETPIVTDLVTPLTVFSNGTISVESDVETTIPELNLSYPLDMASLVARLNDAVNQNSKLINLKADKKQEDWITATLKNGYVNTVDYQPTAYYKDNFNRVYVEGGVKDGSVVYGTVILNLPDGYRPSKTIPIEAHKANDGSIINLEIETNGNLVLNSTTTTGVFRFSGSFRAV